MQDFIPHWWYNIIRGLLIALLHCEDIYWDKFSKLKWKDNIEAGQRVDSSDQRCEVDSFAVRHEDAWVTSSLAISCHIGIYLFFIKGFIKNSDKWKMIEYSKKSGKIVIMRDLECITREKELRMWLRVIKNNMGG